MKPEEIKNITFEQSVFSGYKKEEVDAFLDKVYEEVSKLYRENAELVQKLKVCAAKIEEYRQDEHFLKSAIINAQKLNETALKEIAVKKQQADEHVRAETEKLLADAKRKADALESEAKQRVSEFREKTTAEFAEKRKNAEAEFSAQKKELSEEAEKQLAHLDAVKAEVSQFKGKIIELYKEQLEKIENLPVEAAMPVVKEEKAQEVQEVAAEEAPMTDQDVNRIIESVMQSVPEQDEPVETAENPETIEAEAAPQTAPEAPAFDAEAFAESIKEEVVHAGVAERSPVEPEVSPLFFSSDMDDMKEEPAEDMAAEQKPSKRYKNLKFGIDFDVNNDK